MSEMSELCYLRKKPRLSAIGITAVIPEHQDTVTYEHDASTFWAKNSMNHLTQRPNCAHL